MTLRHSVFRSLVHYYVALKLSAGAVAPMLDTQLEREPFPIVRRYFRPNESRWDPLEVVAVRGHSAIITMAHGTHRTRENAVSALIGRN